MNKSALGKIPAFSLAVQAGWLVGIVSVVALVTAALAYAISGVSGVLAALAAGGASLVGGELALVLYRLLLPRVDAAHATIVGMLARMGLPLLVGVGLYLVQPWLAQAGLFFYFLVYYAVILAVETAWAVARIPVDSNKKAT